MVSFFQVLFSLGTVYRADLPKQFYDALAWLKFLSFDIFDLYPPQCLGAENYLVGHEASHVTHMRMHMRMHTRMHTHLHVHVRAHVQVHTSSACRCTARRQPGACGRGLLPV